MNNLIHRKKTKNLKAISNAKTKHRNLKLTKIINKLKSQETTNNK